MASAPIAGLRVGYFPAWMKQNPATDVDRAALEAISTIGLKPVELSLPEWPYDSLNLILFAEGAAAFEELTLKHGVDQLKVQDPRRLAEPVPAGTISYLPWISCRPTGCGAK